MTLLAPTESFVASDWLPPIQARPLSPEDAPEVRRFLAKRPLQTFGLLGMIDDNGLVSPHNRGDFYAYYSPAGDLEGVALIGHNTLIDAGSGAAIRSFAELAQARLNPFLLLAPLPQMYRFIEHYSDDRDRPAAIDRYRLYTYGGTSEHLSPLPGLRQATAADLEQVVWANNQCGIEETGADSMKLDPEGFRARCARRIELGRTWVWTERGELVAKLEVLTATPEVTYLESLWVCPAKRRRGYGARLLHQVSEQVKGVSAVLCFLAEEGAGHPQQLYARAGYIGIGYFGVVFCDTAPRP